MLTHTNTDIYTQKYPKYTNTYTFKHTLTDTLFTYFSSHFLPFFTLFLIFLLLPSLFTFLHFLSPPLYIFPPFPLPSSLIPFSTLLSLPYLFPSPLPSLSLPLSSYRATSHTLPSRLIISVSIPYPSPFLICFVPLLFLLSHSFSLHPLSSSPVTYLLQPLSYPLPFPLVPLLNYLPLPSSSLIPSASFLYSPSISSPLLPSSLLPSRTPRVASQA